MTFFEQAATRGVPEACNFIKKETLGQVFSCEFCEIFKNTFFTEHLQTTASMLYDHVEIAIARVRSLHHWSSSISKNLSYIWLKLFSCSPTWAKQYSSSWVGGWYVVKSNHSVLIRLISTNISLILSGCLWSVNSLQSISSLINKRIPPPFLFLSNLKGLENYQESESDLLAKRNFLKKGILTLVIFGLFKNLHRANLNKKCKNLYVVRIVTR